MSSNATAANRLNFWNTRYWDPCESCFYRYILVLTGEYISIQQTSSLSPLMSYWCTISVLDARAYSSSNSTMNALCMHTFRWHVVPESVVCSSRSKLMSILDAWSLFCDSHCCVYVVKKDSLQMFVYLSMVSWGIYKAYVDDVLWSKTMEDNCLHTQKWLSSVRLFFSFLLVCIISLIFYNRSNLFWFSSICLLLVLFLTIQH